MKKQALIDAVFDIKARSAWHRGVIEYAKEILEDIPDESFDELTSSQLLKKAMLNGAEDWQQYSYGGCALIYDGDIAERLCTPSELKRVKHGERQPSSSENWLDVQERALFQAGRLILSKWRQLKNEAV